MVVCVILLKRGALDNDLYINIHDINIHDITGVQLKYIDSVLVSVKDYDRTFHISKSDFARYLNVHCNQGINDNNEIMR